MLHSHGKVGTFFITENMEKWPGFCLILSDNIILICNSYDMSIASHKTWTDPEKIGWVKVG